jgi:hypothetical protein
MKLILSGDKKQTRRPELWDSESAKRIVAILKKWADVKAASGIFDSAFGKSSYKEYCFGK